MNKTEIMVNIARKARKNKNFRIEADIQSKVKIQDGNEFQEATIQFNGLCSIEPTAFQLETNMNGQQLDIYLDEENFIYVYEDMAIKMGQEEKTKILNELRIEEALRGIDKLIVFAEELQLEETDDFYCFALPQNYTELDYFKEVGQTMKLKDPNVQLITYDYELKAHKNFDLFSVKVSCYAVREDENFGLIDVETEAVTNYSEFNQNENISIPQEIIDEAEENE